MCPELIQRLIQEISKFVQCHKRSLQEVLRDQRMRDSRSFGEFELMTLNPDLEIGISQLKYYTHDANKDMAAAGPIAKGMWNQENTDTYN